MKDKILTLIIGILIGAIITSVGFFVYTKVTSNTNNNPQMQNGQMMGEPPSMPGNGEKPDGEPPAKPGEENNNKQTINTNSDSSNDKQETSSDT